MKNKPQFPYKIKRGSAVIRVYEVTYTKKGQDYTAYRVMWYDTQGKQKTDSYTDWRTAITEAYSKANDLSRGELDAVSLTGQQKLAYVRACDVLQPFGIPLDVAAARFSAALNRLGKLTFEKAIEFAALHLNPDRPSKTVREVLNEMIVAKRADGVSNYRLRDLNVRCGAFADQAKCLIENVTVTMITDYVRSLNLEPKTRNHYRNDIITLCRFAVSRGYIAKDAVDFDGIPKAKEIRKKIVTYTPDEMAAMLKAASAPGEKQALIQFVLQGFEGMRREEVLRLDWAAFDWKENHLRLDADITKTGLPRTVPIHPGTRLWLRPIAKEQGPVMETKKTQRMEARISKASGVNWKKNALRRSYASYRYAVTRNIGLVSEETGSSVQTLKHHYRDIVRPSDARKWFALTPAKVKKSQRSATITPLPQLQRLAQAA